MFFPCDFVESLIKHGGISNGLEKALSYVFLFITSEHLTYIYLTNWNRKTYKKLNLMHLNKVYRDLFLSKSNLD